MLAGLSLLTVEASMTWGLIDTNFMVKASNYRPNFVLWRWCSVYTTTFQSGADSQHYFLTLKYFCDMTALLNNFWLEASPSNDNLMAMYSFILNYHNANRCLDVSLLAVGNGLCCMNWWRHSSCYCWHPWGLVTTSLRGKVSTGLRQYVT